MRVMRAGSQWQCAASSDKVPCWPQILACLFAFLAYHNVAIVTVPQLGVDRVSTPDTGWRPTPFHTRHNTVSHEKVLNSSTANVRGVHSDYSRIRPLSGGVDTLGSVPCESTQVCVRTVAERTVIECVRCPMGAQSESWGAEEFVTFPPNVATSRAVSATSGHCR